jgi:uncharacterized protein
MNIAGKIIAAAIAVFAFSFAVSGQTEKQVRALKANSSYDAEPAKRLGADDYGMKPYVFVILKTGPTKIEDAERRKQLQAGHIKTIGRLAEEGKLVLAGPFIEGGNTRGIYVFDVKTVEQTKELVKTDPAIKEGLFEVEFIKWYGSAALLNVNGTHKKIQKNSRED